MQSHVHKLRTDTSVDANMSILVFPNSLLNQQHNLHVNSICKLVGSSDSSCCWLRVLALKKKPQFTSACMG